MVPNCRFLWERKSKCDPQNPDERTNGRTNGRRNPGSGSYPPYARSGRKDAPFGRGVPPPLTPTEHSIPLHWTWFCGGSYGGGVNQTTLLGFGAHGISDSMGGTIQPGRGVNKAPLARLSKNKIYLKPGNNNKI